MSYLIRCDQCQREIPEGADYWELMPHRQQRSYSLAEMERRHPDLCSAECLRGWLDTHPLPGWPTEVQP